MTKRQQERAPLSGEKEAPGWEVVMGTESKSIGKKEWVMGKVFDGCSGKVKFQCLRLRR